MLDVHEIFHGFSAKYCNEQVKQTYLSLIQQCWRYSGASYQVGHSKLEWKGHCPIICKDFLMFHVQISSNIQTAKVGIATLAYS